MTRSPRRSLVNLVYVSKHRARDNELETLALMCDGLEAHFETIRNHLSQEAQDNVLQSLSRYVINFTRVHFALFILPSFFLSPLYKGSPSFLQNPLKNRRSTY